jgi:hypothetical protein
MGDGAACIPNIGKRERRKRLASGVVFFAVSAAIAAALLWTGTPRLYRLGVFLPLWMAATGYFQAREKT